MRFNSVVLIPIFMLSLSGCQTSDEVAVAPDEAGKPEEPDIEQDLGNPENRNRKRKPADDTSSSNPVTQLDPKYLAIEFANLLQAKKVEAMEGIPPPNIEVLMDTCEEILANGVSLKPRYHPSLSDGLEDPWNTIAMYRTALIEGTRFRPSAQYFVNDGQDLSDHLMIRNYAMMHFLAQRITPRISLLPYHVSRPSANVFKELSSVFSTRGLVVNRLSPSYKASVQFLVTEPPGPSIRDIVRVSGYPLKPITCLIFLIHVFKNLQKLHSYGIVHGNIHWGNFVTVSGGTLVMTDFRFARFAHDSINIAHTDIVPIYLSIPQLKAMKSNPSPNHAISYDFGDDILRAFEIFYFMSFGEKYVKELLSSVAANTLDSTKTEYMKSRTIWKSSHLPEWFDAQDGNKLREKLNEIRDALDPIIKGKKFSHTTVTSSIIGKLDSMIKLYKSYHVSHGINPIGLFENDRVADKLFELSHSNLVDNIPLMNNMERINPMKDLRQIESVFRGKSFNDGSDLFTKYLTSCVGLDDSRFQHGLHLQSKIYVILGNAGLQNNFATHFMYLPPVSFNPHDTAVATREYIYRPIWPPGVSVKSCTTHALMLTGKKNLKTIPEYINGLEKTNPRYVVIAASKICIALIKAIQKLHLSTGIIYNNFFVERIFVLETPGRGDLDVFLYDMSRASSKQIGVEFNAGFETAREVFTACPQQQGILSDVYGAAQMFLKIIAGTDKMFLSINNRLIGENGFFNLKRPRANRRGEIQYVYFTTFAHELSFKLGNDYKLFIGNVDKAQEVTKMRELEKVLGLLEKSLWEGSFKPDDMSYKEVIKQFEKIINFE